MVFRVIQQQQQKLLRHNGSYKRSRVVVLLLLLQLAFLKRNPVGQGSISVEATSPCKHSSLFIRPSRIQRHSIDLQRRHGQRQLQPPQRQVHLPTRLMAARQVLQDCICLVTGASRGIGKGIAIELGAAGAIVYVTGTSSSSSTSNRSSSELTSDAAASSVSIIGGTVEETAAAVTEAGGLGIPVICNHGDDDDIRRLVQQIDETYGRLDILINNAFRLPPKASLENLFQKFWQLEPNVWDVLHTIGPRSHYVTTSFAMPLLLRSASILRERQQNDRSARKLPRPLIGMISSFGALAYSFNLPYGVAKASIDRMVKDMASELDGENICIVSFWPGLVMTEQTQQQVASGDWEKYVGIPLDQAESPRFTGKAVVAMANDPNNLDKSGTAQVVAELAEEYGFTDMLDGEPRRPASIRSLRFLIHSYGLDEEQRQQIDPQWIPNIKLPFWLLSQGKAPTKEM